MFQWLADHRRKKLTDVPFPAGWEDIVRRNVAHYCMLSDAERAQLRALIQVFIAEKKLGMRSGISKNYLAAYLQSKKDCNGMIVVKLQLRKRSASELRCPLLSLYLSIPNS